MGTAKFTYGVRLAQPVVLAACVCAACVTPPIVSAPAAPALLAVVTWNMDAGDGDLPRLVSDLETGRLAPAPAKHFVVLLQEAVSERASEVESLVQTRRWSMFLVPVHYDGRRTRSNAILSSEPMAQPRTITLPRQRQPRRAAAATIMVEGQRLFVVSAHLENRVSWWKGALFSDGARGRQAEALVRELPDAAPGILGGDLNTWLGPHEPAWRLLTRRFPETPAMKTPTFRERLVLDHLFFDLPPGWHATTHVVRDKYGSDHHPVVGMVFGG